MPFLTHRFPARIRQRKAAHRKLDELCAQLIPSEEDKPGQQCEQRDVVILRSMPGLGRTILAVLLAEVWQPLRRRGRSEKELLDTLLHGSAAWTQ